MVGPAQRSVLVVTASVLFCTLAVHVPLELMAKTEIEHKAKIDRSGRTGATSIRDALEQSRDCDLLCPLEPDATVIEDGYVSEFDLTQPHGIHLHQIIIPLLD